MRNLLPIEVAAARAICRETCAFKGEPPCFEISGEWPPSTCDEPGCGALAMAAVSALAPSLMKPPRSAALNGDNLK